MPNKPHPEWTPRLVEWYAAVGRDFPWRRDTDPYHVWVSEIMLQQTRIEAALGYYRRFMDALPTVADLANVEEDALLKLWEGLGYYSRARNLKKAAVRVVDVYGGSLPASYDDLLTLPGIGEYTAGAIASISFGIPVPAVDGNVLRVISRLTASRQDVLKPAVKKAFTELVRQMVPADRPGVFTQAIMELGETVCLPNTAPLCERCPLRDLCAGCREGVAAELPVRSPKKPKRPEERTVLVIVRNGRVLLHRREPTGLLANLWELPSADGRLDAASASKAAVDFLGAPVEMTRSLGEARHLFSHIEWKMVGFAFNAVQDKTPVGCVWADEARLRSSFALPSTFRAYARQLPELLKREETP
ncbi:MAG: A/G-specific adenine glycosylase [Acutalibacteraceae bacterium]|jgi:A/G-specific adenine glycosylase